MPEQIKITYTRSAIGRCYRQKRVIKALGFTKLHQSRVVSQTPPVWGMINKVRHLLNIEPLEAVELSDKAPTTLTTSAENG